MYMFDELESVVLKTDIKECGLEKGDIGTVIHIYKGGKALEIEFATAEGKTIAVLTLAPDKVRPMAKTEILHARGFTTI